MPKAIVLRMITGSQIGRRYTLTERSNIIGSAANCAIVLNDRMIEPRHAEIRQMLDRWFVTPLTDDGRGISLNGMAIRGQSRLNAGDTLTIGSITYSILFEEIVEAPSTTRQVGGSDLPRLGNYFIRRGILTADQVAKVVNRQAQIQHDGTQLPFGQVAYNMGLITRSQLDMALADQRADFNDRFAD